MPIVQKNLSKGRRDRKLTIIHRFLRRLKRSLQTKATPSRGGDFIANCEVATNFIGKNDSEVVHVSVNMWPDDEDIQILKGEK